MFCCVLFFFCLLLYFVVFWEPRKWTRRKRNFRMTRSVISDMFVSLLSFFFYFDGYSHSFILFFSSFFFFFLPQLFRLALNGHDGTCHDLCTFGIFFFFSFPFPFSSSLLFLNSSFFFSENAAAQGHLRSALSHLPVPLILSPPFSLSSSPSPSFLPSLFFFSFYRWKEKLWTQQWKEE